MFIYKLRAFLDYSSDKQFFLFKAFASITSAPPLEKSWLRSWIQVTNQFVRWVTHLQFFMYKLKAMRQRVAIQIRWCGISISLMICKLTDFSTMSLAMLFFICIIQHYLLSVLKNKLSELAHSTFLSSITNYD